MNDYDPRHVAWRFIVGLNRMSWLRPEHWMVQETMRPLDGSACWTEKAHCFAFGPFRFILKPELQERAVVARLTKKAGA